MTVSLFFISLLLMTVREIAASKFLEPDGRFPSQTVLGMEDSAMDENRTEMGMEKFVCIDDFYTEAKSKLDATVWEHIEGGVDDEFAVQQSRKAYRRYAIRPRFLRDVSKRDLSIEILGKMIPFPVGIAPTGFHKMVHPEGEIATAKGAASAGVIYILSIASTCTIEDVADAVGGSTRLWFQLEMLKDSALNLDLITRAEKAGYEAIVLTVDAQFHGKHRPSLRRPFEPLRGGEKLELKLANLVSGNSSNIETDPMEHDTSITWDVVKWIREHSKMKLVIKGIMTAEDATIAAERGVDAIIVSNHGGRMLDCTLATIDVLPEIVAAVPKSVEVYLDGGISLGTDIFKAVALGAKMVFVGRAALWGLAVGEEGVKKVLEIYKSELDSAMALSGVSNLEQITSKFLKKHFSM